MLEKMVVTKIIKEKGVQILLAFVLYVLIGVLSSLNGEVLFQQAIFQFVLDVKFFIVVFYCIYAYQRDLSEYYLSILIKYLVIGNVIFVLFQYVSPDFYNDLFSAGAHFGLFVSNSGQETVRTAGIFWFTGELAMFSAFSIGYYYFRIKYCNDDWFVYLYILLSVFLLASTLSRGEIVSCVLGLAFAILMMNGKGLLKFGLLLFFTIIVSLVLYYFFYDTAVDFMIELGILDAGFQYSPRALFMHAGIDIAARYFPLGAGWGAFGGQSAVIFDSNFFYEYGIANEWYFRHRLYLTDTFWPKVMAESGYSGIILYCSFLIILISRSKGFGFSRSISAFGILLMSLNSISAPVFNSALIALLCVYLIGGSFDEDCN
jgi:hypothetical protein